MTGLPVCGAFVEASVSLEATLASGSDGLVKSTKPLYDSAQISFWCVFK